MLSFQLFVDYFMTFSTGSTMGISRSPWWRRSRQPAGRLQQNQYDTG
jgi:hypothetical protein